MPLSRSPSTVGSHHGEADAAGPRRLRHDHHVAQPGPCLAAGLGAAPRGVHHHRHPGHGLRRAQLLDGAEQPVDETLGRGKSRKRLVSPSCTTTSDSGW